MKKNNLKVAFCDLTHTGQIIAINTVPLGVAYVAAFAKENLKNIDIEIFKLPEDFSEYLENNQPDMVCFSNFSWNLNIQNEYAKRIKKNNPKTVIIFGGPNFSNQKDQQIEFFKKYRAIDFYIEYEGEKPFVLLFNELRKYKFNVQEFKKIAPNVPSIRYLHEGKLVSNKLIERCSKLDELPSPYLTGTLDKFLEKKFMPMIQSSRGCPFQCTFCIEGSSYFRKVPRYSQGRVKEELAYIAKRAKTNDMLITDSNFGIFPQDIETAELIRDCQKENNGFPHTVHVNTSKTGKQRTVDIVKILGETLPASAAVQSTDQDVLKEIKRSNVSQEVLVNYSKEIEKEGGQTEAEIILALEGDNKEKHFKSVKDMLDADMKFIRMHQLILLPGTEASSIIARKKWDHISRFRVLPRCFGTYAYKSEKFSVAEIEEICVGNKTMSHNDYKECRKFNLTVEIFSNDSIFSDLQIFLRLHNIKRSEFVIKIHDLCLADVKFNEIYKNFVDEEERNLSKNYNELEEFTKKSGIIDKYIKGYYGSNELQKYRAIAIFQNMTKVHELAFEASKKLIIERGIFTEKIEKYLNELCDVSLTRKLNCLTPAKRTMKKYHFDFQKLAEADFNIDPFNYYESRGINIEFHHTDIQLRLIDDYINQYGTSLVGLGRILSRANIERLFLTIKGIDKEISKSSSASSVRF